MVESARASVFRIGFILFLWVSPCALFAQKGGLKQNLEEKVDQGLSNPRATTEIGIKPGHYWASYSRLSNISPNRVPPVLLNKRIFIRNFNVSPTKKVHLTFRLDEPYVGEHFWSNPPPDFTQLDTLHRLFFGAIRNLIEGQYDSTYIKAGLVQRFILRVDSLDIATENFGQYLSDMKIYSNYLVMESTWNLSMYEEFLEAVKSIEDAEDLRDEDKDIYARAILRKVEFKVRSGSQFGNQKEIQKVNDEIASCEDDSLRSAHFLKLHLHATDLATLNNNTANALELLNQAEKEYWVDSVIPLYVFQIRRAFLSIHSNNCSKAVSLFKDVYETLERDPTADNSLQQMSYEGLGIAYQFCGQYDSAEYYFKKRLDFDENDNIDFDRSLWLLGQLYLEIGNYELANNFCVEGILNDSSSFSSLENDYDQLNCIACAAESFGALGQYQSANEMRVKQLQIGGLLRIAEQSNLARITDTEVVARDAEYQVVIGERDKFKKTAGFFAIAVSVLAILVFLALRLYNKASEKTDKALDAAEASIKHVEVYKQLSSNLSEQMVLKEFYTHSFSHSILNPLSAINVWIFNLKNSLGKFDSTLSPMLNEIESAAKQIETRATSMLNAWQSESGWITAENKPEDITQRLRHLHFSWQKRFEQSNRALRLELLQRKAKVDSQSIKIDSFNVEVYLDWLQISMAVENLLNNALKYSSEGSEVLFEVLLVFNDDLCDMTVLIEDDGKPLDTITLKKLLKGQAIDGDILRQSSGWAIGLRHSQSIANMYNGSLAVISNNDSDDSALKQFLISFPGLKWKKNNSGSTQNDGAVAVEAAEKDGAVDSGYSEEATILIIDDEPSLLLALRTALDEHYDVLTAENGVEGLESAINQLPDLIISDVDMPIMDGLELCATIKADTRTCDIPFLLLTQITDDKLRLEAKKIGADGFFDKNKAYSSEGIMGIAKLLDTPIKSQLFLKQLAEQEESAESSLPDLVQKIIFQTQKLIDEPDLRSENGDTSRITVEMVAGNLGYTKDRLGLELKDLGQPAPSIIIRAIIIKHVRKMHDDEVNPLSIRLDLGYADASAFNKFLRRVVGYRPTD